MAAGDALVLLAELDGARYAELASLSVAPEARGVGIGTRLLDELDRQLAEKGTPDSRYR